MDHAERDLHRKCQNAYGFNLEPFYIPISVLDDHGAVVEFELATLAPFEVFSNLFAAGGQFTTACLGPLDTSDHSCWPIPAVTYRS